jgi:hypothetical protein
VPVPRAVLRLEVVVFAVAAGAGARRRRLADAVEVVASVPFSQSSRSVVPNSWR